MIYRPYIWLGCGGVVQAGFAVAAILLNAWWPLGTGVALWAACVILALRSAGRPA